MSVQVKVKSLDDKTFDIKSGSAVAELRESVSKETGVAASEAKLTYEGKIMKDGKNLSDYGIKAGAEIQLLNKIPEKTAATPDQKKKPELPPLPTEVKEFFESMLDGLVGECRKPDGSRDIDKIKAALMPDMMAMMGGNWQPLAKTQPKVVEHILKKTNGEKTAEARGKLVDQLMARTEQLAEGAQQTSIADIFLTKVKADKKEELKDICTKHTRKILTKLIDLYLDEPQEKFGANIRSVVVLGVGEFVKVSSPCLNEGMADVKAIMGEMALRLVSLVAKFAPDMEPMLKAFVMPLAQSFAENCLREYVNQAD